MFLTRPSHDRGAAHAMPDRENAGQRSERTFFLTPDNAFDRRARSAAILLGPMQARPASLRLLLLPGLSGSDRIFTRDTVRSETRALQFVFKMLGRIGVDPGAHFLAKRGFCRCIFEIHVHSSRQAAAPALPALMRSIR